MGEWLRYTMAKNAALLSSTLTNVNSDAVFMPLGQLYGVVQIQAMLVSMKEIYGWLLIIAILSFAGILLHSGNLRPFAIFPKWATIRKVLRKDAKLAEIS